MRKINEEIEGLRGIAIVAVIISHCGNLIYWNREVGVTLSRLGLASGVDLFFCISGFVITASFFAKLEGAATLGRTEFWLQAKAFMMRRVLRIMPPALIWLAAVAACSTLFNKSGAFGVLHSNLIDGASVLLNIANIHFAKCIADGYTSSWCGYNGIYWSISLEEQFYLLFPLLVLLRRRWIVAGTVLVLLVLSLVTRNPYIWFTRVDGLLLGMCLAFATQHRWYRRFEPTKLTSPTARVIVLLLICAVIVSLPLYAYRFPTEYPEIITLLCGGLIALASYDRGYCLTPGLSRRTIAYIGSRSFSLYLAHNPAFWLAREVTYRLGSISASQPPRHPIAFAIFGIAALCFLGEASYRWIEVPCRNRARSVSDSRQISGAIPL